ncbi:hypothetical protein GX586_12920 [bacterium]|nr:hypothetical protein [bacterium]
MKSINRRQNIAFSRKERKHGPPPAQQTQDRPLPRRRRRKPWQTNQGGGT